MNGHNNKLTDKEIKEKGVYLDHAATTYTDPAVIQEMLPYLGEEFYNPSSLYTPAREVAEKVTQSRKTVAKWIGARYPEEIIFTGGGSESDNLAITGIPLAYPEKGKHIITLPIEHHAVLHAVEGMEILGYEFTKVPVDQYGIIDLEALEKAIRPDTVLITVMMANNEVGSIQPVEDIGKIAKERGIFFHTDAVQTVGSLPIDVEKMHIDALSMSAHKFYGPKGVGALYLRKGIKINPLIKGGGQEMGRRAGTYNTPGIVGLAKALDLACSSMEETNQRIIKLRDKLIKGVMELPDVIFNGHPTLRLPNNANFCFKYIESEAILLHLDFMGIMASSGSACSAGSEDPSHVLAAMGIPPEIARGSIRMTLGKGTAEEEIDYTISTLKKIIEKLRLMSPLV